MVRDHLGFPSGEILSRSGVEPSGIEPIVRRSQSLRESARDDDCIHRGESPVRDESVDGFSDEVVVLACHACIVPWGREGGKKNPERFSRFHSDRVGTLGLDHQAPTILQQIVEEVGSSRDDRVDGACSDFLQRRIVRDFADPVLDRDGPLDRRLPVERDAADIGRGEVAADEVGDHDAGEVGVVHACIVPCNGGRSSLPPRLSERFSGPEE